MPKNFSVEVDPENKAPPNNTNVPSRTFISFSEQPE
jgi:hypothetical protein